MFRTAMGKSERRWIILIWAIALSIQLAYLAEGYKDPTFFEPVIDASTYDRLARTIASGQLLPDGAFWQPPLYQYLLALIYFISGPHMLIVKLIQALIGATSCLITYLIGKRLYSRAVGIIAGLIMAFYGPMIFFNSQLLSTGLEVFLDTLALWLLLLAAERARPSRWLACGLVLGIAAITRPTILVLLAVGLIYIIVISLREGSYRALVLSALCLILGTALTIAPATICNYMVERRPILISTNGGINLFIGNNPRAEETIAIRPGVDWKNLLDMGWTTGAPTRIELDQYFSQQAKAFFIQHPKAASLNLLRKARLFWNSYETPRNVDIYTYRRYSRLLSLLVWRFGSFSFPFGILAPIAFLGMIVGFRGRIVLLAFVALYSAAVIAFFITARYRLPIVPVLAVFAAQGIVWFRNQLKARRLRPAAMAAIFCIAAAILVNLPVRAPAHGVNFLAELHNFLGMRNLHTHNDYVAAEDEFRRSLAIEPASAVVHGRLGSVLALQDRTDDAIEECHSAVELDPDLYEAHYTLANLLTSQDHYDEALEHYRHTIAIKPDHAEAHNNLAGILARRGKTQEAIQHFRKSLTFKPDAPEGVYLNMVLLLKNDGRFVEAADVLKTGIHNHPESTGMKANLAWLLATCPEERVRNGSEAVRLAESACAGTGYSNLDLVDTLAAAYAEAGRFDEAVKVAREAARISSTLDLPDLSRQIEMRLKLYQANKPYRESNQMQ